MRKRLAAAFVIGAITCVRLAGGCAIDATVAGFPCPCPDDAWECVEDACFLKEENAACEADPPVAVTNVRVEYVTPKGAMIAWDAPASPEPPIGESGLYFVEVTGGGAGSLSFTGVNARGAARNDELRRHRFDAGASEGALVGRTFVDGLEPGGAFTGKLRVVGPTCAPVIGEVAIATGTQAGPQIEGFPSFSAFLPLGPGVIDTKTAECAPAARCLTTVVSCAEASCASTIGVAVADPFGFDASAIVTDASYFEVGLRVITDVAFPPVGEGSVAFVAGGDEPRTWRWDHVVPRTNGERWLLQVPLSAFTDAATGAADLVAGLQSGLHLRTITIDGPWPNGSRVVVDAMFVHVAAPGPTP